MPVGRLEVTAGQRALLAMAAVAVGLALQIRDGHYAPPALALLGVALACALAVTLDARFDAGFGEHGLVALLGALLGGQLVLLLAQPVARSLPSEPAGLAAFQLVLAGAALSAGLIAMGPARARPLAVIGLLLCHFAAGLWILHRAAPETDVFNFQRASLEALRNGVNPYAIGFRNIYHPNESFYGPGLVKNGILQFGYPYPPLPLLLTWPALYLGDIRYAHLAALTLGGAAIAFARPGRVAPLAAALLLFSPRFGLLLQMSWTEPFTILFLGLTVWAALRAPRLLPLVLGLFLASKQYLVFAAPAAWLLVPGPDRARRTLVLLGKALLVALAVTLPLALWHPKAFLGSAITLQFRQPFRNDALSVLVPLARAGVPRALGVVLPLLLAPAALVLALRRCPRTPAGFALAVAFVYLVFLAFNKQAFCNYYFFPMAALCAAIAATEVSPRGAAGGSRGAGP
jgi:hypothetical protein